jgi:hypothetical protein
VAEKMCATCAHKKFPETCGGCYSLSLWAPKKDELAKQDAVAKAARALDVQVSGDHYKSMAIQPVEFIHANNIPYLEGNVIKYVARWRSKGGVADLEKAKHYIDLLIELEGKRG